MPDFCFLVRSHRSGCRQGVHAPAQAPDRYVAPYLHRIEDPVRRLFAGMLSAVDGESDLCCFACLRLGNAESCIGVAEGVGNVTKTLQSRCAQTHPPRDHSALPGTLTGAMWRN